MNFNVLNMDLQNYLINIYWRLILGLSCDNDRKVLFKIWENILKSRLFEEKILSLVKENKISKHYIFSGIGQEGTQAVVATISEKNDYLIPSYRGYAPVISRGFPLPRIAAEILGKKTGPALGIGSSSSFTVFDYNIFGKSSILGLDFGTIIGLALSLKKKNTGNVAILFFGDGTATRGSLWSALNLSVLWNLPILWVCENNQYSLSTHISKLSAASFAKKARSFGLLSETVDGNNAAEVYFTAKKLLKDIREKKCPAFIEAKTFRVANHDLFFFTNSWYQNQEEYSWWKKRDPLMIIEKLLFNSRVLNNDTIINFKKKIKTEVEEAFSKAENQIELTKEELLKEKIDI